MPAGLFKQLCIALQTKNKKGKDMAQEGIYKNPILLNQLEHKSTKVAPVANFNFAQQLNAVVVTGHEFIDASKSYPIVFVSDKNGEIVPLAVLGLRDKSNLFTDDAGKWQEGAYIPAFVRRYPFILAENDPSGENFSVSVDAAYEGFNREEGMMLFDEEGKPSHHLQKVMEFLRQYQMQNLVTKEFVNKLAEYDLLKDFTADITMPSGPKLGFRGLKMINEKALQELDDDKALDLFRRGFMGWVYGHLFSLSNFRALGALEAKKAGMEKSA